MFNKSIAENRLRTFCVFLDCCFEQLELTKRTIMTTARVKNIGTERTESKSSFFFFFLLSDIYRVRKPPDSVLFFPRDETVT